MEELTRLSMKYFYEYEFSLDFKILNYEISEYEGGKTPPTCLST